VKDLKSFLRDTRTEKPSEAARVQRTVHHARTRPRHGWPYHAVVSMDFFEVVHTQRSIRQFKPDAVPDEAIWKMLDAAIRAPSGSNTQPWAFLVVRDRAKREAIAQAVRERMGDPAVGRAEAEHLDPARRRMRLASIAFRENVTSAPVLIIPCLVAPTSPTTDANNLFAGSSIYSAVQNLMLAARALGLGTVLTTFNMRIEDVIRREFGLPDDAKPVAVIPVGYPDGQRFGPTTRKPVESVTFWDAWSQTREQYVNPGADRPSSHLERQARPRTPAPARQ
jgi:F420 biosynthesis protein FbiB-like protein